MNQRPEPTEFAPYFATYINLVPAGNLISILEQQLEDSIGLIRTLPEEKGNFRYASDKWSLKEVIGHIIDTERIMSYRALRIARGDLAPLPGFDQDAYVKTAESNRFSFPTLADDFSAVRKSTLTLLSGFSEEAWLRRGISNNYETTVRAIGFVIAGHELHHRNVIQERYEI